jgi:hypothetical protein
VSVALELLSALALTLAIELPLAAALGLRTRRSLLTVALINLITNPLLNFIGLVLARFWDWGAAPASAMPVIITAEVVVVLAEWRLLLWVLGGSSRRMLVVSLALNGASAAAGLIFWLA